MNEKERLSAAVAIVRGDASKAPYGIATTIVPRQRDSSNAREAAHLAAVLAKQGSLSEATLVRLVARLARLARESHRLAEYACERELSKLEESRDNAIDVEVQAVARELGIEKAWTQGDPRGYAVRLLIRRDDGRPLSNNMGGEDFGL